MTVLRLGAPRLVDNLQCQPSGSYWGVPGTLPAAITLPPGFQGISRGTPFSFIARSVQTTQ
jgi:hypothetical protein